MFGNLFPGLGIALVAFGAYVIVDNLLHPANIEELKRQARESANRPSLMSLLQGKKAPPQEQIKEQEQ